MAECSKVHVELQANEMVAFRAENAGLRYRAEQAEKQVAETLARCKELEQKVFDSEQKIKFLDGQIEAYQYCMNCRR